MLQLGVAGALRFIFLLKGKVHVIELVSEHFVLVVKGLADLVKLLVLLAILVYLFLLRKALFCQLANLHLVVLGIEQLPLVLL